MLKEFGVVALRWTDTPDAIKGVELPTLEFIAEAEIRGVRKEVGFRVKPPMLTQRKRRGGRHGSVVTTAARDQSMRLLFWWLKSRLEAAKFGLEPIEKTLLSKVMVHLPDGSVTTVGEAVHHQLALPSQSRNLLPTFEIKREPPVEER